MNHKGIKKVIFETTLIDHLRVRLYGLGIELSLPSVADTFNEKTEIRFLDKKTKDKIFIGFLVDQVDHEIAWQLIKAYIKWCKTRG